MRLQVGLSQVSQLPMSRRCACGTGTTQDPKKQIHVNAAEGGGAGTPSRV